jgi:heparin binding hemagglutinin HbhA
MATRTSVTPLYVIAGAGDLAVEKFREVRGDVTSRFAKLDQKTVQSTLQTELTKRQAEFAKRQAELAKRFEALAADAKTVPAKLRELPAVAQAGLTTVLGQAEETYDDLAARGQEIVGRIRNQKATEDLEAQAKTTVSKAKATRTTVRKTAETAERNVKATATSARKTAKSATKAAAAAAEKIGD